MALFRSISRGLQLTNNAGRPLLFYQSSNQLKTVILKPCPAIAEQGLSHDEKNKILKRPLSPHLTVYKFELPALMSISHRISGMALSGYAVTLAAASVMSTDIPHMVANIQAMGIPSPIIFTTKLILALPASYHLFNGIRHLIWDMGKALTLKQVYLTGYVTLAISTLFSIYLASL